MSQTVTDKWQAFQDEIARLRHEKAELVGVIEDVVDTLEAVYQRTRAILEKYYQHGREGGKPSPPPQEAEP